MVDIIELRGHHLLCIHGFQGMGYSDLFVKNMTAIVKKIRDDTTDFPIKVTSALDDACGACPHNGGAICQADPHSQAHVVAMDNRVLKQLGLVPNQTYLKSDLIRQTAEKVQPEDLNILCAGCSWLSYGICKQGIQNLRQTIV